VRVTFDDHPVLFKQAFNAAVQLLLLFALWDTVGHDEPALNLRKQEEEVLATIPRSGLRGVVLQSDNDHLRSAIRLWFRKARKRYLKRKRALGICNTNPGDASC
jgi:hypothetical protein